MWRYPGSTSHRRLRQVSWCVRRQGLLLQRYRLNITFLRLANRGPSHDRICGVRQRRAGLFRRPNPGEHARGQRFRGSATLRTRYFCTWAAWTIVSMLIGPCRNLGSQTRSRSRSRSASSPTRQAPGKRSKRWIGGRGAAARKETKTKRTRILCRLYRLPGNDV